MSETQALSPKDFREKVMRLEAAMLAMQEHQVQIETKHYFAPGLYMREIFVPKDVTLVGKIQKTEYLNIVSQGEISVMTEAGYKRVKAPCVVRSKPGLKRAGYAHEDSIWLTVHQNPTNERDIDKLEAMLFADSFDEVPEVMSTKDDAPVVTLQGKEKNYEKNYFSSKRTLDDVLKAIGTTCERMQAESENLSDQLEALPPGVPVYVSDSPIHGKGVFASVPFKKGEIIGPARISGLRTAIGRFSNHSGTPNSEMVMLESGDVYLRAIEDIQAQAELLTDYYLNYVNSRRPATKLEKQGDQLCQA